jgi:hypothetical protein
MSRIHAAWPWLREWVPYVIPAIVNVLLIVLGVVMSLPKLAEKIEDTPKYRKWLAVVCIAAGFVGFYFDVRARHDSERTSSQLLSEVGDALARTNQLLTQTSSLVTNTGTLATFATRAAPQLAVFQTELADLRQRIEAAREKHDPQMIHDLEAKAQAAQLKTDDLSRELLAITKAPVVASELRDWKNERDARQQNLHNFEWEDQVHYEQRHKDEKDQKGVREIQQQWQVKYEKADEEFDAQLKDLVATADSLRKELLQRLPPPGIIPLDKLEEQRFAQATANPLALDRNDAAAYLEVLAQRIPAPK